MEFRNQIEDIYWLIGSWEGKSKTSEGITESELVISKMSDELLFFKERSRKEDKFVSQEQGYFFYDKLQNELKMMTINLQGYIEIAQIKLSTQKKHQLLHAIFTSGFNLPPNSKIIREFDFDTKENVLTINVKMGKNESLVLVAVYQKK